MNEKIKRKMLVLIILVMLISFGICVFIVLNNRIKSNYVIPDNYIAVFHGGSGEVIYETYIYKNNKGDVNYGFDYINVTKTATSAKIDSYDVKITKRGSVEWTDNVFEVANDNGAYSYVTLPNNSKTYTIEQFRRMFLMN